MEDPRIYPSHDILRENRRSLNAFFSPRSVAVIGATDREGSVGQAFMQNLKNEAFRGRIYGVNPGRSEVLGVKCFASIKELPETPDLTVIAIKAKRVPGVIQECAEKGCKNVIIISAGFKEIGEKGTALEREILSIARKSGMRIIGPNCLGIMRPQTGLNATFANGMAKKGSVAFISQSGALCTSILDWSRQANVGFSTFVSIGSMLDVNWGDLLHHLGGDPYTKTIVLYIETIGDAHAFMSAAREVALSKPIIVLKAGATEEARKAANSHTGSLAGSFDVLRTAFRRVGVLRVERIAELFYMADLLSKQPRPRGNRLAILTNAGGPGVLSTDALIREGGQLAKLAPESIEALNAFLPPHWSHGNPVDILGDAPPETYRKAMDVITKDPNVDGILVVLSPQPMCNPTETAKVLSAFAKCGNKPISASWMGGEAVDEGRRILSNAGIPTFDYPDTAAKHFVMSWRYDRRIRNLYETPRFAVDPEETLQEKTLLRELFTKAKAEERVLLNETESKQILAAYGIPTVPTFVAKTANEAVSRAERMGYPVVLKLNSYEITHKSDVGGVILDLDDAAAVRDAFQQIQDAVSADVFEGVAVEPMVKTDGVELILGSKVDGQFGPVLLFGAGGRLVEITRDHALGLPPLNTTLARMMMQQTRIYHALHGVRGKKPVDLDALEQLLVRFSQLVIEQPRIQEIDINPLLVSDEGMVALDARIVLHPSEIPDHQLPRPAIRPYPVQYISHWALRSGTEVTIRPIMAEDEPMVAEFHRFISDRSVYLRYFQALNLSQRIRHERLIRVAHVDYSREMAIVMETDLEGVPTILAIGRLSVVGDTGDAEFAMLIRDDRQREGIGSKMLTELVAIAKAEGMRRVIAEILPDNRGMQRVCERVGFTLEYDSESQVVHAAIVV